MEALIGAIGKLLAMPLLALFKTIIMLLNLIPLPVYELHGHGGYSRTNRPDLRSFHITPKGRRRVHLGTFISAWTRGAIVRGDVNTTGGKCLGVYNDELDSILDRWAW